MSAENKLVTPPGHLCSLVTLYFLRHMREPEMNFSGSGWSAPCFPPRLGSTMGSEITHKAKGQPKAMRCEELLCHISKTLFLVFHCLLLRAGPLLNPPPNTHAHIGQTSINCQHYLVTLRKDIPRGKQTQQKQKREAEISKSMSESLTT